MKKAIIIGATSGIGQEVAKCLLLEGWKIGVAGRRQSSLENLQRAAPDQIQIQALDVTQEDASEKLNLLIDKLGGMDLFLLSSGIGFQNMDLNMEVELNTAHTNVAGFIRMVDTAFTYFKKNGGGHLAVISSIAGTKGLGVAPAYSATKGAVIQLSKSMAAEYAKENILVNCVCPGGTLTPLMEGIGGLDEFAKLFPIGRLGQPEEIARVIVFLASDEASFTVGSTVLVDGGFTCV